MDRRFPAHAPWVCRRRSFPKYLQRHAMKHCLHAVFLLGSLLLVNSLWSARTVSAKSLRLSSGLLLLPGSRSPSDPKEGRSVRQSCSGLFIGRAHETGFAGGRIASAEGAIATGLQSCAGGFSIAQETHGWLSCSRSGRLCKRTGRG